MSNSLAKELGKNIIEFNEEFIINNSLKLADENIRKRLFNTIDKINSSVVNNFKSLNFFLKFVLNISLTKYQLSISLKMLMKLTPPKELLATRNAVIHMS